eukprot:2690230-Pleurochrysis_carterae.AAC.2
MWIFAPIRVSLLREMPRAQSADSVTSTCNTCICSQQFAHSDMGQRSHPNHTKRVMRRGYAA